MSQEKQRNDETGAWLREIQRETHRWRLETIGNDITPMTQLAHARNEMAELSDPMVKATTYDESWMSGPDDRMELKKEAGDVILAYLGVLSLMDMDAVECVELARGKNDDRDWDEHTGRAD